MKVLSLFDGISCGMVALDRAGITVDNTEGISNTQRYKCIGNCWTVDVIAHILKNLEG